MRTKVISLLLATALAATAPMAPAQANTFDSKAQRNAAALVVGLATLALIAKAAEEQRDDKKKKKKKAEQKRKEEQRRIEEAKKPQVITRSDRLPFVHPREYDGYNRPHRRAEVVPASCARRVQTERGVRTAFGAPCLRRAGVNVARLPDRCEQLADVGRRDVKIWGARCLQRNGVRID